MESEQIPFVFVAIQNENVQGALVDSLARRLTGVARVSSKRPPHSIPGAVVVTASDTTSLEECSRLQAQGAGVVVLAAVPDLGAQAQYLGAGALAYLPMALDLAPLVGAISQFLTLG